MKRRNPKRHFVLLLCLALLYSIVFSIAASADDSTPVRVGIYENPPKIFTDNDGKPSGFWPDLIEYIASEEGWNIEWVHSTWTQCLKRLRENEIDIMPDVSYTEERSKLYAFSSETVLASWSRVYAREGADIQSILDLEGKNIAVLRSSANVEGPEGIKELVKKFDIHCAFTEVDSYTKVFELLEGKKADAGVTNKDFGNRYEKDFGVKRTPIIFRPSHIQFAFPNSSLTPYLIERIDYHMKELKADGGSIYYQLLEKWLAVKPGKKPIIPDWTKWALIGIGGLAFLLLGGSLILRSRVLSKTKELRQQITERKRAEELLRESEARYKLLFEKIADAVFITSFEGEILEANLAASEQTGYSHEELIGMNIMEDLAAEEPAVTYDKAKERLARGETVYFEEKKRRKDGTTYYTGCAVTQIEYKGRLATLSVNRDITERKQAEEALRRERDLAAALEEAAAALTATLDFEEVLDRILEEVGRVVPNDAANIMLIEGDEARIVRWRGYERFGAEKFVSKVVFHIPKVRNLKQMRESMEPVVIPDIAIYPEWLDVPVQRWLRSYAAVPIIVRGEVIGFLNVDSATPGFFTKDHAEILRAFANHAAAAIENARLYEKVQQELRERVRAEEELKQHVDQLDVLNRVGRHITSSLQLDEVLRKIVSLTSKVVKSSYTSIVLLDEKGKFGESFEDFKEVPPLSRRIRLHGMTEKIIATGEPVVVNEVFGDGSTEPPIPPLGKSTGSIPANPTLVETGIKSFAGTPIVSKGKVLGVLFVYSLVPRAFEGKLPLLTTFANQVAAAIENARLYEKVQQELRERKQAEEELRGSFVQLAETVSRAMESHDPYTAGHQRRVAELARAMGKKMGLDKEQLMGLYIGGLLHDIGKISIPEEILTHPGKLTEAEWAIIRAHPRRGYEILKATKFPWPVAEIALQHHERMDGSGYPQGLKGEEILFEARILAVADVVEAMSSHRPYRPALGIKAALSEIKKGKGRLYDPAVVEACLSVFEEGFTFEEQAGQ